MEMLKDLIFKGKLPFNRKYIGWISFYLLPLGLFVAMAVLFNDLIKYAEFTKELGEVALVIFVITMYVSPLSKMFPQIGFLRLLVSLRKELGVIVFWLVVGHGSGQVYTFTGGDSALFKEMLSLPVYFWGMLAAIGIYILGLTSNNFSMRLFKKAWKKIHYVAYPTLILAVTHVAIVDFEEAIGMMVLVAIYFVLRLYVYLQQKRMVAQREQAKAVTGSIEQSE